MDNNTVRLFPFTFQAAAVTEVGHPTEEQELRERISFQVRQQEGCRGGQDMQGSFCRNDAFRCDVYSSSTFLLFSRRRRFFDIDLLWNKTLNAVLSVYPQLQSGIQNGRPH